MTLGDIIKRSPNEAGAVDEMRKRICFMDQAEREFLGESNLYHLGELLFSLSYNTKTSGQLMKLRR